MNVIDIVILVILGASVVYGLYRGFIHTLLSVACCLISVFVAFSYGPRLSALISGSQGVTSTLATYTTPLPAWAITAWLPHRLLSFPTA